MLKNALIAAFFAFILSLTGAARADTALLEKLATGGTGGWVNTERPLTVDDFKGRLILLDFWTYGCINCMQVIPDLDALEKQFPQLLVIGVHSAKYQGEGLNDRIRKAAERFGIRHPVMNDNDYKIWDLFGAKAWPTFVLIDDQGREISRYAGEGHRKSLARDITKAIAERPDLQAAASPLVAKAEDTGLLAFPSHITYAPQTPMGALFFVSDTAHHQIVGFDALGAVKIRIGSGQAALSDGDFKTASFNRPRGMTVIDNKLYVADTDNHALRLVDLAAGTVTTLAGDGQRAFKIADNKLASPWDVEPLADGKVLAIAMAGTHQLGQYNIDTGKVSILAGSGKEDITDGAALKATFAQPSGLSFERGNLYFVDAESSSLRVLTAAGQIETRIGTGLFDYGRLDGAYPKASLQHPQGVFAAGGKLYVADTYNNALRVFDESAKLLSTIKFKGAELSEPGDVLVQDGKVYITDTGHHRVVVVDLATNTAQELKLSE